MLMCIFHTNANLLYDVYLFCIYSYFNWLLHIHVHCWIINKMFKNQWPLSFYTLLSVSKKFIRFRTHNLFFVYSFPHTKPYFIDKKRVFMIVIVGFSSYLFWFCRLFHTIQETTIFIRLKIYTWYVFVTWKIDHHL